MAIDPPGASPQPDEAPLDLSSLRPSQQGAAYEARIAAVMRAAAPQLGAYREHSAAQDHAVVDLSTFRQLRSWRRPVLAISGLAAAAALALLLSPVGTAMPPSPTLASAAGVPAPLVAWVEQGAVPTTADLVTFLNLP
jgi:hypothetical protein